MVRVCRLPPIATPDFVYFSLSLTAIVMDIVDMVAVMVAATVVVVVAAAGAAIE